MNREEERQKIINEEDRKKMDKEYRRKVRAARNAIRMSKVSEMITSLAMVSINGQNITISDNDEDDTIDTIEPPRPTKKTAIDYELLETIKKEKISSDFEESTDDEENENERDELSDEEENTEFLKYEHNNEADSKGGEDGGRISPPDGYVDPLHQNTLSNDVEKQKLVKDIFGSNTEDEETDEGTSNNIPTDSVEKQLEDMFGSSVLNEGEVPVQSNCANTTKESEHSALGTIQAKLAMKSENVLNTSIPVPREDIARDNQQLLPNFTTLSQVNSTKSRGNMLDNSGQGEVPVQSNCANTTKKSEHLALGTIQAKKAMKSENLLNTSIPVPGEDIAKDNQQLLPNFTTLSQVNSTKSSGNMLDNSGQERISNSCASTLVKYEHLSQNSMVNQNPKTVFVKKKGSTKRVFKTKLEPVVDLTSDTPIEKSVLRLEETVEIEDEDGPGGVHEILGTMHITHYGTMSSTTTTTTTTQSVKVENMMMQLEEGEIRSSDEKPQASNNYVSLLDKDDDIDYAHSLLEVESNSTATTVETNSVSMQNQLEDISNQVHTLTKIVTEFTHGKKRKHKKQKKSHSRKRKHSEHSKDLSSVQVIKQEIIYVSDEDSSSKYKTTSKNHLPYDKESSNKSPIRKKNENHSKRVVKDSSNESHVKDKNEDDSQRIGKESSNESNINNESKAIFDIHQGNIKKETPPPSTPEKNSIISETVLPNIISQKPGCSSWTPEAKANERHHRHYRSNRNRDSSNSSTSSSSASTSPSRKRRKRSLQCYSTFSSSRLSSRSKSRSPKRKKSCQFTLKNSRSHSHRRSSSFSSESSSSFRSTSRNRSRSRSLKSSLRRYRSRSRSFTSSLQRNRSRSRSFSPQPRKSRLSTRKYYSGSSHRHSSRLRSRSRSRLRSRSSSEEYRRCHNSLRHDRTTSFIKQVSVSRQMLDKEGNVQNQKHTITQKHVVIKNQKVFRQGGTTTAQPFNKELQSFKKAVETKKYKEDFGSNDPVSRLDIRVHTDKDTVDVTRQRPNGDINHPLYILPEDRELYNLRLTTTRLYVQAIHEICHKNKWNLPRYFVDRAKDGHFCYAMKLQGHLITTTQKAAQKKLAKTELAKVFLQWMGIIDPC